MYDCLQASNAVSKRFKLQRKQTHTKSKANDEHKPE